MTDTAGGQITEKKAKPWAIAIFEREDVAKKFKDIMGKRWMQYITSIISVVSQSEMLKKAKPESVYLAAMTAATLDLPINPNLWFAYILPYGDVAQFQMWYKWFIQLAQRSWQFQTISASAVYKWQLIEENPLTWYVFDWKKKDSDEIIWYASYFKLLNWFEKVFYMTKEELEEHGKKFSKSYWTATGLWKKDFDAMATKTVLKLLISKYAPLSVEMQTAVATDQWVFDENWMQYSDNEPSIDAVMEWFETPTLPNNSIADEKDWLS